MISRHSVLSFLMLYVHWMLYTIGYIHGDISPHNILVHQQIDSTCFILNDFGVSQSYKQQLTLSKVSVQDNGHPSVTVSISFKEIFQWVSMIGASVLNPIVSHLPQSINNVQDMLTVLDYFGSVNICVGNPETKNQHRSPKALKSNFCNVHLSLCWHRHIVMVWLHTLHAPR